MGEASELDVAASHVSHSRVEAYLSCRRKEYYSYGRKLQKRETSTALALGTAIHSVLEALYKHVLSAGVNRAKQEAAYPEAVQKALEKLDDLYKKGFEDSPKRATLREIIENYLTREPFIDRGWAADPRPYTILAVEKEFNFEYDPETHARYPFVVDLIVRDPNGRILVIDNKGLYDFYSPEEAELKPQIVKYIGALRGLGHKVYGGMYNMLRTRPAPKTRKRKPEEWADTLPVEVTAERIARTMEEQIELAYELTQLDEVSPEERDRRAVRSAAGSDTCQRMCDFRALCIGELRGDNLAILMKNQYQIKPKRPKIEVSDEV